MNDYPKMMGLSTTVLLIVYGFLAFTIVMLLRLCVLRFVDLFSSLLVLLRPKWKGKVLFIIAHPDDECMFFGPSLHQAIGQSGPSNVYILCLTNGNYYGHGKVREKELFESCFLFGLQRDNVKILDNPYLQDGNESWDNRKIITEIHKFINGYNINTVVTFDKRGVSGHPNHKAIYFAICDEEDIQKFKGRRIECYFLETVNILRKYVSLFDFFYSVFSCYTAKLMKKGKNLVVTRRFNDIITTTNAMKKHKSQFVWFRKLYIAFSRYIIMNTLDCREIMVYEE